jgi:hypothetical protein
MEFLNESLFNELELTEATGKNGKSLVLSGILMQADVKNRNNRIYPKKEIEKAVNTINERLRGGESILGELDHPQSLTINLDRVSHVLTEAVMDGSNAIGKLKLVDTPMGKIAKELINSGVKLGVSSRGTGRVAEGGKVDDYHFATMDIVAQPSAPGAFPNSVMESLNLASNRKQIETLSEAVLHDEAAQKYFKTEILKFIESLK